MNKKKIDYMINTDTNMYYVAKTQNLTETNSIFHRVNSEVAAVTDFAHQMAVQIYHKPWRGGGSGGGGSRHGGKTNPQVSLTDRMCGKSGAEKLFSPWHHLSVLFDSCVWLKVKSGI